MQFVSRRVVQVVSRDLWRCSHESHSNAGFRSRATSLGILKNRDKVCDKVEKAQAKAGDEWRWYEHIYDICTTTDIDWHRLTDKWKCEVWRTGKLGEANCKVFLSHSRHLDTYPCFDYDNMSFISMLPGDTVRWRRFGFSLAWDLRPFWFKVEAEARLRPWEFSLFASFLIQLYPLQIFATQRQLGFWFDTKTNSHNSGCLNSLFSRRQMWRNQIGIDH